ncbi:MAG: S8 family serine peptidase [Nitrospirae bacterium]|nr:S8 family serine peptidase [Nitrospirota bacterium]
METTKRPGYAATFALLFLMTSIAWLTPSPALAGPQEKLDKKLLALGPKDEAAVIVRLNGGPVPGLLDDTFKGVPRRERMRSVVKLMRESAESSRKGVHGVLKMRKKQGLVKGDKPLWVINGLAMTARRDVLEELAARPEVDRIYPDEVVVFGGPVPAMLPLATAGQNLDIINAPDIWSLGFTGEGVVVASIDSGVDVQHPALASSYRGGQNSWFDPYGQHAAPYDALGHGTQTTGIIVGKAPDGTVYGVAPGAKWIAAKAFNDSGNAVISAIHEAYQWALDPDGNPDTDDAPDIVNNSWGSVVSGTCDQEFNADIQAFRTAGILPVFSAGNFGPSPNSGVSPANDAGALSVGGTDLQDVVVSSSSRGPSSCDGSIFPLLTAPGWDILTTDLSLGGSPNYVYTYGTSFAAPHVSGAAAVLLSALKTVGVDQLEQTLISTAMDLGQAGPDNSYGNGRVDLLAAMNSIKPDNVSVSAPAGVEGAAQQVEAAWSSMAGAGYLNLVFLQVGSGSIIKLKYDHSSGLLYLLSDDGSAWLGGFAPGSPNTVSGKYGLLDCSKTTVTPNGDNLTVSFNITPQPGLFGQQPLFMYAYDDLMNHTEAWQNKGTWSISPAKPTPVNVSVNAPDGNEGVPQQVVAKWGDTGGADLLRLVLLQVGSGSTGGVLKLKYDRVKNLLYLLNDAGNAWLGGHAPGSTAIVSNSRGTLDCSKTTVSTSGNELTVSFNIKPAVGYYGKKPTYLYAYDSVFIPTAAWSPMGSWRIRSTPPVNLSAAAPAGNTGSPALVTASWRDNNGASDLAAVYIQIGNNASGGVIKLRYNAASNKLFMLNNAGSAWLGGFAPGSANTIAGIYGTLDCSASTVSFAGTDLTVVFSVTPSAGYTGSKRLFIYALDKDSNHPPAWEQKGTWTISAP